MKVKVVAAISEGRWCVYGRNDLSMAEMKSQAKEELDNEHDLVRVIEVELPDQE